MPTSLDLSAEQLHGELFEAVKQAPKSRRPVLHHLNADTSWLLSVPYPQNTDIPRERFYFNVLIDPWLKGSQSDVASWFSRQWHAVESSVQSIAELNERLREAEEFALTTKPSVNQNKIDKGSEKPKSYIDAVVISHEFTDHMHKETLLEVDSLTPVLATDVAADIIKSWHHFESVYNVPRFLPDDPDWTRSSISPLPHWLGVSRVVTSSDALYYHSAILIAFKLDASIQVQSLQEGKPAEAVIYTPHGVHADDLSHLPAAKPEIKTLALLHGLHDVSIVLTKQLNLGAFHALKAQRVCNAKYWCGTHDEIKIGGGMIAPLLRRKVLTLEEALEEERLEKGYIPDDSQLVALKDVRFAELASGESLLLE
ncbi:hypothetical protein MMC20_003987 [Loxospora ochrophaea]|nr:hypothetical protein [Loxospora ochrophaea]